MNTDDPYIVEEGGVDLHVHTNASDGSFSPEQVMEYAHSVGLEAVAVCDHDTTEALDAGARAAAKRGIEFVPGIEFGCPWRGEEHHLLGYYFDAEEPGFVRALANCRTERKARMKATVEALRALGVDVPLDILERKGGMIDRGDIVWELINRGCEKDFATAYPKYFWSDKPGYILPYSVGDAEPLTLRRCIEVIHRAGGVAVLAHPVGFYVKEMPPEQVREAVEWGLDGLEVYHPRQTPEQNRYLWSLVKEFNLIATGGSDCHGKIKDKPRMGTLRVRRSLLDGLKAARR